MHWKTLKIEGLRENQEKKKEDVKNDTLSTLEDMDAEDRKIAYQRYNMISSILPFMANETM